MTVRRVPNLLPWPGWLLHSAHQGQTCAPAAVALRAATATLTSMIQTQPASGAPPAPDQPRLAMAVWLWAGLAGCVMLGALASAPALAQAAPAAGGPTLAGLVGDDHITAAREALRVRDKSKLAEWRDATLAHQHPLASWAAYWELNNRLLDAQQAELDAFAQRWRGTYVEDRLRNDWLLELGRRRDWANFRNEYPRFRMNDDKEVHCYALLARHLEGQDVAAAATVAWHAQRGADDGCQLLAQTLREAQRLDDEAVWQHLRALTDINRQRAARQAAELLGPKVAPALELAFKDPAKWLRERARRPDPASDRVAVLALWRLAANDPDAATQALTEGAGQRLTRRDLAWAWSGIARQAAFRHHPLSFDFVQRAWAAWGHSSQRPSTSAGARAVPFGDDTLAWHVRAALRAPAQQPGRWGMVQQAIQAMSEEQRRDATWVYWAARARRALAAPGADGDAERTAAWYALQAIASPLSFYGLLAQEELAQSHTQTNPITPSTQTSAPAPAPASAPASALAAAPPTPSTTLAEAERLGAQQHPGLQRALRLIQLGLRNEDVREWNFSLRGMAERELLAAAALACDHQVWDRCINTSERTRTEVDMDQRYPMPLREALVAKAKEAGVEPAFVYGLIRQESRFILDARSHVGASGLMQLMPATARWTATRLGMRWRPEFITDRDTNLLLGNTYLRLLLDDFGGNQALATAAYNAGPNRPRRWRDGPPAEAAAWVESIPFTETRDYVKKVLSNAVVYASRLGMPGKRLKDRLGAEIGPREGHAGTENRELP